MTPMLTIAVRAARKAGILINRAAKEIHRIPVETKQHNDFVTEVDRASERCIYEVIKSAYPDHDFLGEEKGAIYANHQFSSDYLWIVDPLDGTTNFIHKFPQYCVSIALLHQGKITEAVIYDPTRDELFTASRGKGAFLDNERIRVSKVQGMSEALIGTGFAFRQPNDLNEYVEVFRAMTDSCVGLRRAGAAALDLAYVAAGRLDGFFEKGLSPWDMAAGALLVTEAGGLVGDFSGNSKGDDFLYRKQIIAAPADVFAQMVNKCTAFLPTVNTDTVSLASYRPTPTNSRSITPNLQSTRLDAEHTSTETFTTSDGDLDVPEAVPRSEIESPTETSSSAILASILHEVEMESNRTAESDINKPGYQIAENSNLTAHSVDRTVIESRTIKIKRVDKSQTPERRGNHAERNSFDRNSSGRNERASPHPGARSSDRFGASTGGDRSATSRYPTDSRPQNRFSPEPVGRDDKRPTDFDPRFPRGGGQRRDLSPSQSARTSDFPARRSPSDSTESRPFRENGWSRDRNPNAPRHNFSSPRSDQRPYANNTAGRTASRPTEGSTFNRDRNSLPREFSSRFNDDNRRFDRQSDRPRQFAERTSDRPTRDSFSRDRPNRDAPRRDSSNRSFAKPRPR